MREVKPGDVVFHLVDKNAVVAVSVVKEERDDTFVVPNGTQWPAGKAAYLLRLHKFTKLAQPIDRSDYLAKPEYRSRLLDIAAKHDSLFFSSKLEFNQGAYLTIAPPALVKIWDEIYSQKTGNHLPLVDSSLFASGTAPAATHAVLAETAVEDHALTQKKAKQYLEAFKQEAAAWFAKATFVKGYFEFFRTFFKRENLEKAEWTDIQRIGEHLHCFQSMALAKARALGKPNHSIEHYRKSFIYLAHGPGQPTERIRQFCDDSEYCLLGFGKSAVSELVGYLFPEQFMFVNARDQFAAELLGINIEKQSGEDLVGELEAFSKATRPVAKLYEEIVGRQTELPLNLEVDQFFSWLFENNESETPKKTVEKCQYWTFSPGEDAESWEEFQHQGIMAIGWDEMGDLRLFKSKEAIRQKLQELWPDGDSDKKNDTLACFEFANDIQVGDIIFVNKGRTKLIGYGRVESGYDFDSHAPHYKHVRKVKWLDNGEWPVPGEAKCCMGRRSQISHLNRRSLSGSPGRRDWTGSRDKARYSQESRLSIKPMCRR